MICLFVIMSIILIIQTSILPISNFSGNLCSICLLYRMNNDQRHFPMLREYEKAKMAMQQNQDLEGSGAQMQPGFHEGSGRRSPFRNFQRTTAGKKLYFRDPDEVL